MLQARPRVVLDTNIVLDWLVFRDPRCQSVVNAITAGALEWVATEEMRTELAHVLARGVLDVWVPDHARLWSAWREFSQPVMAQTMGLEAATPQCSDPDDQKFIDLALSSGAAWLFTRDRAVLKLSSRARAQGLRIMTPDLWRSTSVESVEATPGPTNSPD